VNRPYSFMDRRLYLIKICSIRSGFFVVFMILGLIFGVGWGYILKRNLPPRGIRILFKMKIYTLPVSIQNKLRPKIADQRTTKRLSS